MRGSGSGRALLKITRSAVVVAVVLLAVASSAFGQDADEIIEPLDLGLTERTGRQLMFLDVEGIDQEGLPLPGLTKDDFRIKLDYTWRKLYSVDNLCPCSRTDPDVPSERLSSGDPARQAVGQSDRVFVLYFDFSALQLDGREQALEQARRWVNEVKQPGDRAMVVGYSSAAGLETRQRLSADPAALLLALDDLDADPEMLDPFPSGLADRQEVCRTGTLSCYATARRDYFQARRSYRTLMYFLTLLDDIPERKVLFFFHQNNVIAPGTLYSRGAGGRTMMDGQSSGMVPDNLKLMGRLAGTATSSRTSLYPIAAGERSPWSVNLGANLADFTGGDYNRGDVDAASCIDAAGRGCACIYRLGLEAPERSRSKVFRAKIRAGDTMLPSRYRLQYMTDYDRWERRAMAVLNSPQDATDLAVHAAVLPVQSQAGKWQMSVQVAFDVKALELFPEDGKWVGEWEVGALLSDERGRQTWEMLAVSRILRTNDKPSGTTVLHERVFEDLAPGVYQLRAFVRDRTANAFGGARSDIELPDVKEMLSAGVAAMAGPVMLRPDAPHLRTGLPFLKGKELDAPWQSLARETGPIPMAAGAVPQGQAVVFATWACPGKLDASLKRSVNPSADLSVDGVEDRRAAAHEGWLQSQVEQAGQCVVVRDRVATGDLNVGGYTYRVGWPTADEPGAEHLFDVGTAQNSPSGTSATAPAPPVPTTPDPR